MRAAAVLLSPDDDPPPMLSACTRRAAAGDDEEGVDMADCDLALSSWNVCGMRGRVEKGMCESA